MPPEAIENADLQIPAKENVPLRIFPITVPILTFSLESLYRPAQEEEFTAERAITENFGVVFSRTTAYQLLDQMRHGQWSTLPWYRLAKKAERLSLRSNGEQLLVLSNLRDRWRRVGVITYPHQVETATKVLTGMDGRAILADEVGLGKTIEACMILKEYMLRNMVRRCLILTPASLCWQWYNELKEKFAVLAAIQRSEYDWERCEVLIASLDTAKRPPHCDIIQEIPYDLLIVDEAHKLKNPNTRNWQFVNSIKKKYFLMLTATPVQNDLKELYTLITLLKPGQLGTYADFQRQFMVDKRMPRNTNALRQLLSQVMIRNRRGQTALEFTKRHVYAIPIDFSPGEQEAYDKLTLVMRESARTWGGLSAGALSLITLQREICSSPLAAAVTLQKLMDNTGDAPMAKSLESLLNAVLACQTCSKADMLVNIVASINDKVIVFTEYRATQQYLRMRLEQAGFATLGFDGSLSASRKDWMRELFRKTGQVLVSTESGGEGLNFQFACHVINYDLPWNPMRLEQRIGRVHRLGQTRDVHIYNMATNGTIEEHILFLLYEKINMFNLVIGELDVILAQLGRGTGLERKLYRIAAEAVDDPSLWEDRLRELASDFLGAQDKVRAQAQQADRWLTW